MGKPAPCGNSPRRKELPVLILVTPLTKAPILGTVVNLPNGDVVSASSQEGQRELRRRALLRRLSPR